MHVFGNFHLLSIIMNACRIAVVLHCRVLATMRILKSSKSSNHFSPLISVQSLNNSSFIKFSKLTTPKSDVTFRDFSIKKTTMVDPKRVVSYEDVLKVINQPQKVIIDVRNPDEVQETGKIPSSINIPLNDVRQVLATMSDEDFRRQYQRPKPSESDELIFYCHAGRRSNQALDKALELGYSNSKSYMGSWSDWASKQKTPK